MVRCCFAAPCIARRRLKKTEANSLLKEERCEQEVQAGEEEDRLGVVTARLAEAEAHAAQLFVELAQARQELQRQEQDFGARLDQLRTQSSDLWVSIRKAVSGIGAVA